VVKIIFKNVGQGDSIILEWCLNEIPKYAIIDCNIYQGTNPILKHVIENDIKEIEFMILSHPHKDHFGGFYELLSHCRDNDINVRRFLHTAEIPPDYLKTATRSILAEEELFNLFNFLKEMRDNEEILINSIEDNSDLIIPLADNYKMEVLAPSSMEKDKYVRGVNFPFDEEDGDSNPNANWLSTVLKIYNDKGCVLLTSDVESSTLTRIGKKKNGRIGESKVLMAQIPHHGAKGNLNKPFWQMRKRGVVTPVVISVGENGYKHPAIEVISFFDKMPNYKIVCTNMTGALFKETERTKLISQILDIVSKNRPTTLSSLMDGDKVFTFDGDTCLMAS